MAFNKINNEEKDLLRKQMVALISNNNDTFLSSNSVPTVMRRELLFPRNELESKVESLLNKIIEDTFTSHEVIEFIYCNPLENNPYDRLREINNSLCVLNNVETAKAVIDSYYKKPCNFDSQNSETEFLTSLWMKYIEITLLKELDPKDLKVTEITFYLCAKKDLTVQNIHEYLANIKKFEISSEDADRMLKMINFLEKEMDKASEDGFFYDKEYYQIVFLNLFSAIPHMGQFQDYLNEPGLVEITPSYLNMIKRKLKEFKLDGKIIQNKKSILNW